MQRPRIIRLLAAVGLLVAGTLVADAAAPVVTATLADSHPDTDSLGRVRQGETIAYRAVVTNSGTAEATGVQYQHTLDANATYVPGSFKTTPVAVADSYQSLGNVGLDVPAPGVLVNDLDPDGDSVIAVAASGGTAQGGSYALSADGSFTYAPPVGYEGTDSFSYTIRDGTSFPEGGQRESTGTVSVAVSGVIWFIDNSAGAGDGRLGSPFNSLAAFNAVNDGSGTGTKPATGDRIYLATGSGNYTDGIVLRNGQKLIGQGASASLASIAALTVPPQSRALPATGGTRPVITNSGGHGVTLAQDNTLRGFTVGDTPTASCDLRGSAFGTLTVANDVVLNGSGQPFYLYNGTLSGALGSITSSDLSHVELNTCSGSLIIEGGSLNLDATGFRIAGGSASVTYRGDLTKTTGTGPTIQVANHTTGTVTFETGTIQSSSGTGICLSYDGGSYNFLGTATLTTPVEVMDGCTGTFNFGGNINLTDLMGNGLCVYAPAALVNFAGSINTDTGQAIWISLRTGGTVSFGGPINCTGSSYIRMPNNAGGSTVFSGPVTINTSHTQAFEMANCGSHAVTFSGGLNITTTSGTGLVGTTGGTLTVTGANNSITSSTGSAINLQNVTIGASGVTFKQVTSNGTGTASGIILKNTGTGPFTITGSGTPGSGGVIANRTSSIQGDFATGVGLALDTVKNVSLSYLQINDCGNWGIRGFDVDNLTMNNVVVSGANGNDASTDEGAVSFGSEPARLNRNGLTGSATATNCTFSGGCEDNFRIANLSGTLDRLNMTGTTIGYNSTSLGNDGILIEATNSAVVKVTVDNCTFAGARGDIMQLNMLSASQGDLVFSNNSSHNSHPNIVPGGGGLTISGGGTGSTFNLTYDINNNAFSGALGTAINIYKGSGAGTMRGSLDSNVVGQSGTDSGSAQGSGIAIGHTGAGTTECLVTNNLIRQYNNYGVYLSAGDASGGGGNGAMDVTVSGNTISLPGSLATNGIHGNFGIATGDAHAICCDIQGNEVSGDNTSYTAAIRVRHRFDTSIKLPGYGGSQYDTAGVADYLAGRNSVSVVDPDVEASAATSGSGGGFTGGGSCSTPFAALPTPREFRYAAAPARVVVLPNPLDQVPSRFAPRPAPGGVSGLRGAANISLVLLDGFRAEQLAPRARRLLAAADRLLDAAAYAASPRLRRSRSLRAVAVTGNGTVGQPLTQALGTLAVGQSIRLDYNAVVNEPVTGGATQISTQATVSGANFTSVVTDDPSVGGGTDPTVSLLAIPPSVTPPANLNVPIDTGLCTSTQSFAATASGVPAPTVAYKIDTTTITSPYAFPIGTATVDITAGNGVGTAATASFTVTVTENAPPVLGGGGGTTGYTEGEPAVAVLPAGTITDCEPDNFASGSLTVDFNSTNHADDRLSIINEGTGGGQIGVSGDLISYGGTNFAMANLSGGGGSGSTPLNISFSSTATTTKIQALLRKIGFHNVSAAPTTAPRTVRFTVVQPGDGAGTAIVQTVSVSAVNSNPVVANNAGMTVPEGGTVVLNSARLQVTDADNTAAQLVYTLVAAPTSGTLQKNSSPLGAGGTFTQDDINNGRIGYVHGGAEPATEGFTFTVSDGAGGSIPSTTFNITITPVNDPPVLTNNGLTVTEGQSGATIGTSVLSATDPDNSPAQVVFTLGSVPTNGTLKKSGTPLAAGGTFTLADLSAGVLTYTHNGSETTSDSFTFTVSDGAGGSIGSTAFAITVTSSNDAPVVATNNTLSLEEGAAQPLNAACLRVTDADNTPPQLVFTIGTAPINGTLRLNTTGLSSGSSFTQDDVDNGRLGYTHNGSETLSDSFTFTVSDGAGGSISSTTFNITVTAVNDPPTLTNNGLTVTEGQSDATIGTSVLSATDPDNSPAQVVFTLGSVPTNGTLKKSGTPLAAGGTFTQDDLTNGRVSYTHSGGEATGDSFTFTVSDGAGGSIGTTTFSITVTAVNDPPQLVTNSGLTVGEGGSQALGSANLLVTDADNTASEIRFTLATATINGTLRLNTTGLSSGGSFTQDDLTNGRVSYTHSGSETSSDSFSFTVSDGAGGSISSTSFAITITPVNDPPVVATNSGLTLAEGATAGIDATRLQTTDADNTPAQLIYAVTVAPTAGVLQKNSVALGAGGTFNQDDLNNNRISYIHGGGELPSDSFGFSVGDGTTIVSGQTFAITITPVNDPPTLTNTGASVAEAGSVTLTTARLAAADVDNTATELVFTIGTASINGTLRLNTTGLSSGGGFTQGDLANGRVSYSHSGNESTSDSFTFTVSDGAGGSIATTTFALTVVSGNDPPVVAANSTLTVDEGASAEIGTSLLRIDDSDDSPANRTLRLDSAPAQGRLQLSGGVLAVGGTFTQGDIDNHRVSYTHGGSETTSDSFTFTASDALGASASPATFSVAINPINDPPALEHNLGLGVVEAGSGLIGHDQLWFSDPDHDPSEVVYTLTTATIHGELRANSTGLTVGSTFSQEQVDAGHVSYTHDGSDSTTDSFGFTVTDGVAGAQAGSFAITIGPLNDPPVVSTNAGLTLAEAATGEVGTQQLQVTDADNGPVELAYTLTAVPTHGRLTLAGAATTVGATFTQEDIDLHRLAYTHDGGETTSDRFSFTVSDGAGGSVGATDFAITINPVNDPPVLTVNTGAAIPQGGTAEVDADDLAVSDPDNGPSELVYNLTAAPAHGALILYGAPLAAGGTFTQADLDAERLSYRHDGSETRTDGFTFTVSDGDGGSIPATTFTIAINNVIGPPARLAFEAQPPAGVAGQPLATAVTVLVQDSAGDTVNTASHSITLRLGVNAPGATLTGTLTAPAVDGLATFNNLVLDRAGTGYVLNAGSGELAEASSNSFDITAASPAALAVLTQLPTQQAGQPFELQVEVRDAAGRRVLDAANTITLSLAEAPAGATLLGVLTRPAADGLATFSDLALRKGGFAQIRAAAEGLGPADGNRFAIGPASAAKLAWLTQPADAAAGEALAPVEVEVRDSYDNKVHGDTRAVTVALGANPTDATLTGTLTVTAADAVARFGDLRLNKSGSGYALVARAEGLNEAASTTFSIGSNQPAGLAFVTQPANGTAGSVLAPVKVEVRDALGNRVTGSTTTVTLALGNAPAGTSLGGTISRAAADGTATFDDLRVDRQAAGYRLVASAASLASDTSAAFDIAAAALDGTQSSLAASVTTARGDGGEEVIFTVSLRDSFGNPLPNIEGVTLTADAPADLTITSPGITDAAGSTTARVTSIRSRMVIFTAFHGTTVLGSPVTVDFVPGPASAERSTATVPAGRAGDPTTVAIEIRDSQGNLRASGGDAVAVTVRGANEATPTVVDAATGLYTATYTPLRTGTDQVEVTVAGTALSGSPFASVVSPGAPDPENSTATLEPPSVAANGSTPATLTITAVDAQGNPIPNLAGEDVTVTGDPAEGLQVGPAATTDQDGRTQVELRSAQPGAVTLTITLDGVALAEQPVVTFRPELVLELPAGRHFVGLPFEADDTRPEAIYGAGLGVQVAAWDGGVQRFERYRPPGAGGDLFDTVPGCGMWVQIDQPRRVSLLGDPVPETPFLSELAYGWECLANPYDRDLEWRLESIRVYQDGTLLGTLADVSLWTKVRPYVWYYDSEARTSRLVFPGLGADRVPRRHGFWAAGLEPGISLELTPPAPGRSRVSSRAVSLRDWSVKLVAASEAGGSTVSLGVSSQVNRAVEIEAPPEGEPLPLELAVLAPDGRHLAGSMLPPTNSFECELVATSRTAGEVTLSWPSLLRDLPRGLVLTLTDRQSGRALLLNTRASLRYTAAAGEVRRFAFSARIGRFDRTNITQVSWQATRGGGMAVALGIDGPAVVLLTVRGLGGQLVRQVASQAAEAGTLSITWDGLDASGRRVPRGTYTLEAVATSPNGAAARATRTVVLR